jgi:hypothetical protein
MSEQTEQKHPAGAPGVWKRPNFKGIVIGSVLFIVVMLVAAVFLVKTEGGHLLLHTRQAPATQN